MSYTREEMEEIKKEAKITDRNLTCSSLRKDVYVIHSDLSLFIFACALLEERGDCLIVYHEHSEPHVWEIDDLDDYGYVEDMKFLKDYLHLYEKGRLPILKKL